ncbi:discoidin domain-containing protein [Ramlibacter sp. AW1]|uniref:Discoidin domain-containing protein n=1 Tax=Ramlibacter aurantiacus TaxID=2801330 RepID=A0A937D625_9BURK|nr:discoidin domain-containing protein [Ramlibacter aurantiacus]MBL0420518.1 discoidin domain-containing protein [Ramlibacter aurantiacus]
MAAHRYWRVYVTANNSNGSTGYAGFLELELRASIGGADECTGGTASASGVDGINAAANAFDNNTSTRWYSSGTLPSWIKYDFGAGNAKDIVEFAGKSPGVAQYTPRDFELQYSDDNSSWTPLITVKGETNWRGTGTFTVWNADTRHDSGADGQLWRINMTAQQGGASTFSLMEVQMRASSGGADECSGGYAFASSMNNTSTMGAFAAFDDNASTGWQAYSTGEVPSWLAYKFASAKSIVEVVMTAPGGGNQVWAPADFTVDRWNGSSWETQYTASGLTWTVSETKTFTWGVAAPARRPVVFVCT